jgi:WD40-like Beta Propeller Repeat
VKQAFWLLCACFLPVLIGGSLVSVSAQTPTATPDPFIVQITSNPGPAFNTVIGDMTANGRFVVFVSNGDVSTEKTATRNNADGNREIFLYDYAQRRIFQITNTRHVPNPTPSPSPTPSPTPTPSPSPSPSPTPTPTPTPADLSLVAIEVDNRSPMISLAPALVGGLRSYVIVFSSNAPAPANTTAPSNTDANSEIWIYRMPAVADVDLTLGTDLPLQDLAAGTFFQVTTSTASRAPTPGSSSAAPFFADDNREPAISDDGRLLAFISTRSLPSGNGNADGNPELYFYTIGTATMVQATNTQDPPPGPQFISIFTSNPNLSSDGSVVSFISSANLTPDVSPNNADNNAEIFTASFGGSGLGSVRQVTRTQNRVVCQPGETGCGNTNVFSPGRRLSRNGAFIAFESRAGDPKANAVTTSNFLGTFVYTIASDTFVEVGSRAAAFSDIARFPTFTDYNSSLVPSSLVFASALNFRPDGTFPPVAEDATGLNPQRAAQVFLTQLPASTSNTFIRLSNTPGVATFGGIRPVTSDTRKRTAYVLGGVEHGGGNADFSLEVFYLLSPQATASSAAVLSFFTGASNMPVATATPVPSPSPSPTPSPSPVPGSPLGVAPGELTIVRSTVALAPSNAMASGASETKRTPALPVELNGVSLSVEGYAAGLYFVGNAERQINFVVPIAAPLGLADVVINLLDAGANTDTIFRGLVQIIAAQPDLFTTTNDAGGRAIAFNITNPSTRTTEPFSVTSTDAGGATVPTVLELSLTGVRGVIPTEVTVTIGTTAITGVPAIISVQPNREMPGFDIITFTLPAALANAGDVPVVVTVTKAGVTTSSRPAATAPRITIN